MNVVALHGDPRAVEHRAARELETRDRPRYERSLLPFIAACREHLELDDSTPAMRRGVIRGLLDEGFPAIVIGQGMNATADELAEAREDLDGDMISWEQFARQMPYADYLRTEHWQNIRGAALERARKRCSVCNSDERLDVHHRTYANLGAERPEDVTVLCHKCHSTFHREHRLAAS